MKLNLPLLDMFREKDGTGFLNTVYEVHLYYKYIAYWYLILFLIGDTFHYGLAQ